MALCHQTYNFLLAWTKLHLKLNRPGEPDEQVAYPIDFGIENDFLGLGIPPVSVACRDLLEKGPDQFFDSCHLHVHRQSYFFPVTDGMRNTQAQ
jgi:hypothetical protein